MSFLINKTTASLIDESAIDIRKELPAGVWTPVFDKFRGIFLEKYDYKLSHGKIYGKSQKIADHVFEAFKKADSNLGVLLSGGKGLGKSLTARLVIEHAVNEKIPIIVVNDYLPDLFNFLKNVSNCVILFDEFEKVFSGKANEESEGNTLSKQEEMLSLLDGTSIGTHNLYIMTVNNLSKIDENLKSRPGRIKYHYRYDTEGADTIKAYCEDHLQKKELRDDIVDALLANRYVSLDIIKALVDEVNNFDVTVDEAMQYLNIETDRISVYGKVTYIVHDVEHTEEQGFGYFYPGQSTLTSEFESTEKEDKEDKDYYFQIAIPMKGKKIPAYGTLDVSDVARVNNWCNDKEKANLRVLKVEIYEEGAFTKADRVVGYSSLTME